MLERGLRSKEKQQTALVQVFIDERKTPEGLMQVLEDERRAPPQTLVQMIVNERKALL